MIIIYCILFVLLVIVAVWARYYEKDNHPERMDEAYCIFTTENERLKKAVEDAKKIMISARSQPNARETFIYNSDVWLEKYGKDNNEEHLLSV